MRLSATALYFLDFLHQVQHYSVYMHQLCGNRAFPVRTAHSGYRRTGNNAGSCFVMLIAALLYDRKFE